MSNIAAIPSQVCELSATFTWKPDWVRKTPIMRGISFSCGKISEKAFCWTHNEVPHYTPSITVPHFGKWDLNKSVVFFFFLTIGILPEIGVGKRTRHWVK